MSVAKQLKALPLFDFLFASRWASRPAIWGKLPALASHVRRGVRSGESRAWRAWLASQSTMGFEAETFAGTLPTAFVLPPATLEFAPRKFVVGALVPSLDSLGRKGPLLVYQVATLRWVHCQMRQQALEPRDWFHWLSRILATRGEDATRLERAVSAMWRVHAPRWEEALPWRTAESGARDAAERLERARSVFNAWTSEALVADLGAEDIRSVSRPDWHERFLDRPDAPVFWRQDLADGRTHVDDSLAQVLATDTAPREAGDAGAFGEIREMSVSGPIRGADASILEGLVDPHLVLADAVRNVDDSSASRDVDAGLFEDLNREFVQVVRDPTRLAAPVGREEPPPPCDEVAPTLESLSQQAQAYPLVRDVLQARREVSALIGDDERFSDFELFEMADSRDVLRLFAPELPHDPKTGLPSLVRRSHHVLSLGSAMPMQIVPTLQPPAPETGEAPQPSQSPT